jgi:hypothetical protein
MGRGYVGDTLASGDLPSAERRMTDAGAMRRRPAPLSVLLAGVFVVIAGTATAAPTALAGPVSAAGAPRAIDGACPSAAVPEDGFVDVPAGGTHEAAVDCLVWWQVAKGTGADRYSPAADVTRGQLATLLANLLRASGQLLPDPSRDAFPDDDGSAHEDSIDRLAQAGIVTGRAGGGYAPDLPVTRSAMASLLVGALEHRTGQQLVASESASPHSAADAFTDDDGDVHEPSIDRAAAAGLTGGVSGGRYGPGQPVTREQVASLLARALALLVEQGHATAPAAQSSVRPLAAVQETERPVAHGVSYRMSNDPAGPFATHLLTLSPASTAGLDVALAQDRLEGLETTSSLAARHGAVAAINGDFFMSSGRPLHAFAQDGRMVQAPMLVETGIWGTGDNTNATLGEPVPSMHVESAATGRVETLARINNGAPASHELALFTPEAGSLEPVPGDACSARLRPNGQPHTGLRGATTAYVVEQVRCDGPPMPANGATVLSAPSSGSAADFVRLLPTGSGVNVAWSLGWPHANNLIGSGDDALVVNGAVNPRVDGTGGFYARNPRTALGVNARGQVLMLVVDGRQPGYSDGMTLRELAEHLQRLGAVNAVLLDGGGSATMTVHGQVVNRPSDGGERPVATALLVAPDAAWMATPFEGSPESERRSAAAGQRVLTDPGSTGGYLYGADAAPR